MNASTPIASSKTAALSRVLDLVPRGYQRYTAGVVAPEKARRLARKFHDKYGIGSTPAQRITRKKHGYANAALVMYWPKDAEKVEWLLLATNGSGLERELLKDVTSKRRLSWLGYQLVRRSYRGRIAWTWKLPKQTMVEFYATLHTLLDRRNYAGVAQLLALVSRYPGFHGVRQQVSAFYTVAKSRGYGEPLPKLLYLRKVSHGERLGLGDTQVPLDGECSRREPR